MRTDAEHRALDERLDILTGGLVILVLAFLLLLPGVHPLWLYLIPPGLVFIGMTVYRRMIETRRDTEGLIAGIVLVVCGLLVIAGVDLRFFPVVPGVLLIVGALLIATALGTQRMRRDSSRPAE